MPKSQCYYNIFGMDRTGKNQPVIVGKLVKRVGRFVISEDIKGETDSDKSESIDMFKYDIKLLLFYSRRVQIKQ